MKTLLALLLSLPLVAQTSDDSESSSSNRLFWKANLPGGDYMVKLTSITSVSNHAYILDGAVVVTEVTIDTLGTTTARFYALTPLADYKNQITNGLLTEGINEVNSLQKEFTGVSSTDLAQKNYPTTTHAKTVEYQLSSLNKVKALYRSISSSWEKLDGKTYSTQ